MAEALDVLKCGVVLTSQSGAILRANSAAERMLREGDAILAVRGVLQAKAPASAKKLRCMIRLAAEDETELGKTGLAVRLNEDVTLFAHVLPLGGGKPRTQLALGAVAAVFVGSAAFGLTSAEKCLLESSPRWLQLGGNGGCLRDRDDDRQDPPGKHLSQDKGQPTSRTVDGVSNGIKR